jgi:hypothetical protein
MDGRDVRVDRASVFPVAGSIRTTTLRSVSVIQSDPKPVVA